MVLKYIHTCCEGCPKQQTTEGGKIFLIVYVTSVATLPGGGLRRRRRLLSHHASEDKKVNYKFVSLWKVLANKIEGNYSALSVVQEFFRLTYLPLVYKRTSQCCLRFHDQRKVLNYAVC